MILFTFIFFVCIFTNRNLLYIYIYIYLSFLLFSYSSSKFPFSHFPSACETSFSSSLKAGNEVSWFPSLRISLFCLHSCRIFSLDIESGLTIFFPPWKAVLLLLAYMGLGKSAVAGIGSPHV